MKSTFALLSATTMAVAMTAHVHAVLLVEETFDAHPIGSIKDVTAPASPGLTGGWTVSEIAGSANEENFYVNRTEGDDTPGTNPGTGKAVYDRNSNNNNGLLASRATSSNPTIFASDGDAIYFGFTVDPDTVNGDEEASMQLGFTNGWIAKMGIKDGALFAEGDNTLGGGGGSVGTAFSDALEHRIIARLEFNAGPEVVTLWIDPTAESDPFARNTTGTNLLNTSPAPYALSSVGIIGQGQSGQPLFFDDLRVATTFDEALRGNVNNEPAPVPEPTTALLGGLAVLAIAARRR